MIPYYQEEPGILRGAVMSAMAQEGMSDLEIIVVDDGSLAPASHDLQDLALPEHVSLRLIEQQNGGPGSARNRGLDSVGDDTIYVAFLDSDDRWAKSHLRSAHSILEDGYDLYFSDYAFLSSPATFFQRRGIVLDEHVRLGKGDHFYRYCGDAKLEIVGSRNLFQPSTVVYNYRKFPDIRFPEEFRIGEDLAFALYLVERTDRIVFSTNVEGVADQGIHIFESANWNTPRGIWMLSEAIRWRRWLVQNIDMNCVERHQNSVQIENLRRGFIASLLHQFIRLKGFKNVNILRFIKSDPAVLLDILPVMLNLVMKKAGLDGSQSLEAK